MNTTADTQTTTTWQIDPAHTQVGFVVKHMMFAKVRGAFNEFSGTIVQGENGDLAGGSFSATIQSGSVDTGNADRDGHLRSGDFFDSENFPTLTFSSVGVERIGEGQLKVTGDITIRDITKTITLDLTESGTGVDPWGNMRIGIQAEGTINRKEFGLMWNQALEAGGVLVGDEVTLTIEAQAVSQK
jgi:polyisoprenoid-binding protein YceI